LGRRKSAQNILPAAKATGEFKTIFYLKLLMLADTPPRPISAADHLHGALCREPFLARIFLS
jgi:hypothetical protein